MKERNWEVHAYSYENILMHSPVDNCAYETRGVPLIVSALEVSCNTNGHNPPQELRNYTFLDMLSYTDRH